MISLFFQYIFIAILKKLIEKIKLESESSGFNLTYYINDQTVLTKESSQRDCRMGVFPTIEIRYKVSKLLFSYYGGKEKAASIH